MATSGVSLVLLSAFLGVLALVLLVVVTIYLIVPTFKGVGWAIRQVWDLLAGEIGDAVRIVGAVLTALILVPVVLANVVIGRWSAASHFGRAVQSELVSVGRAIYRMGVGHPARFLCLTPLTDGFERRLPEVFAGAPGSDRPSGRTGQFEGYRIIGSLPGGGSGARLYIAEPDERTLASLARRGVRDVTQVVIKSFSLSDGSSLPQIVRESRSLDAARRLGLILEHELTDQRFYYVMRYVPGDSLTLATQRLHASSGSDGLGPTELGAALSYARDLVATLRKYHDGGLWHKDVKPDNIIIAAGRAHLVDFGLITPLRSAMTLTTHGTEYFRDPEMVRQALKGVKVHEVDGQRFDVYAAGAVIYSVIENSFPAHSGLSQITRRCPESLRWVVRRAMAEYDKRYASAGEMLADLDAIAAAADPFSVRPAELPSVSGREDPMPATPPPFAPAPEVVAESARLHNPIQARDRDAPRAGGKPSPAPLRPSHIRVTDWLTGRYALGPVGPDGRVRPIGVRRPAHEQLASARGRAAGARRRAMDRRRDTHARMRDARRHASGFNAGVVVAILLAVGVFGVFLAMLLMPAMALDSRRTSTTTPQPAMAPLLVPELTQVTIVSPPRDAPLDEHAMHTVLVLTDRVDRGDPAVRASIDHYREMGFDVVEEAAAERDPATDDQIVSLRRRVGIAPFAAEDPSPTIGDWIRETRFAGTVAWFQGDAGGPGAAGGVRAWVVYVRGVEGRAAPEIPPMPPMPIQSGGGAGAVLVPVGRAA